MVPVRSAAVATRPPLPAHSAERIASHDRADFAQEFLRRNPAYRAAWRASLAASARRERAGGVEHSPQHWGLVRFFDPALPARSAPAIWRPQLASPIVSLAPAPPGFAGGALLPAIAATAEHGDAGTRHLVFDIAGVRHRLHVLTEARDTPLTILLPPCGDALRAAACEAARRMFAGLGMGEPAAALRPSGLQRRRLAMLLQMLDATLSGATNREIGAGIVYPWMAGTDAVAWKATSERRRIQRLLAEAHGLSAGGYRDLLIA